MIDPRIDPETGQLCCPTCKASAAEGQLLCSRCGSAIVSGAMDVRELRAACRRIRAGTAPTPGRPRFGPSTLVPMRVYSELSDLSGIPVGVPIARLAPQLAGPEANDDSAEPISLPTLPVPRLPLGRGHAAVHGGMSRADRPNRVRQCAWLAVAAVAVCFGGLAIHVGAEAELDARALGTGAQPMQQQEVAIAQAEVQGEHSPPEAAVVALDVSVPSSEPDTVCRAGAARSVERSEATRLRVDGETVRVRASRGGALVRWGGERVRVRSKVRSARLIERAAGPVLELSDRRGRTRHVELGAESIAVIDGAQLGCDRFE